MDVSVENMHLIKTERIYLWGAVATKIEKFLNDLASSKNVIAVVDNRIGNPENTLFAGGRELEVISPARLAAETEKFSIVVTCEHYDEIVEQVSRDKKLSAMTNNIYYYLVPWHVYNKQYLEKYRDCPPQDIFLFRCGPTKNHYIRGYDFLDNSRAFFEYLLAKGYNERYTLVWLVKNPEEFGRYSQYKNVKFISFDWDESPDPRERDEYYHYLFLAKYIFTSDAFGFARYVRKSQIRVQFWHGCGLKRNRHPLHQEDCYEFMTVISKLYQDIHAEQYGLRKDQILVTGYPKEDWLFQPYDESIWNIFHIKRASKCIFWLPTFRVTDANIRHLTQYELNPQTGLPIMQSLADLDVLNDLLVRLDVVIIIKLHQVQDNSAIAKLNYSNILLLTHMDIAGRDLLINRLLASADALISDYSAAATDYLILNRPIGFTLDDVEDYKATRGFVFDPIEDWLPGKKIYDLKDFCDFVTEIAHDIDSEVETREKLLYQMHDFHDGNSCQRVLEALHIEK